MGDPAMSGLVMKMAHWLECRAPPPLVGLAMLALGWGAGRLVPWAGFDFFGRLALASALVLLGLGVAGAAAAGFWRARTTVDPRHPHRARALVTTGVLGHSRNPMYLGMALMLAGAALHAGNGLTALAVPAFIAFITRFQIIPEERALAQAFGESFAAYRGRVRRWL